MKVFISECSSFNATARTCVLALEEFTSRPSMGEKGCFNHYNGVRHHCGDCSSYLSIHSVEGRLHQMQSCSMDAYDALYHDVKFRNKEAHDSVLLLITEELYIMRKERGEFEVLEFDDDVPF